MHNKNLCAKVIVLLALKVAFEEILINNKRQAIHSKKVF